MILRFIPSIIWAVIILYLSSVAGLNLPESIRDIFSIDKIGHFGIYGIFTILLLKAFQHPSSIWKKNGAYWALIISIVYGISMEVMQYTFFTGRYFEFLDIIANIIGSFTGLLFLKFFNEKS